MDEILNSQETLSAFQRESISSDSANRIIDHIRNQMRNRYRYIIGEWQGAIRAKATSTGQFVTIDEVSSYLNSNSNG